MNKKLILPLILLLLIPVNPFGNLWNYKKKIIKDYIIAIKYK